MWVFGSHVLLNPFEELHKITGLGKGIKQFERASLRTSRPWRQRRERTLGGHQLFPPAWDVLLRCRSHFRLQNTDTAGHRVHGLCSNIRLLLHGVLEKLRTCCGNKGAPDMRPCRHSSLSISFTILYHQAKERAFTKVSSATVRDGTVWMTLVFLSQMMRVVMK